MITLRAFTSFLISGAGIGLSSGEWVVPLSREKALEQEHLAISRQRSAMKYTKRREASRPERKTQHPFLSLQHLG